MAKKWVEGMENNAEKTDRPTSFISDPALGTYMPSWIQHIPTSYTVKGQDEDTPEDFVTRREYQSWWDGLTLKKPHRAMRPPTSLRPTYSRKLGPPNEWDTSDSEEWDDRSDASGKSKDFEYFRGRLRNDFEWELDRLNAQRTRYIKHREKKKKDLQEQEKVKLDAKWRKEAAEYSIPSDDPANVSTTEEKTLAKLNPVEWTTFRALRSADAAYFVIDILTEEPRLSDDRWRTSKARTVALTAPNVTVNLESGQGPLPERIRIRSKELIMILARIHGLKLLPDEDGQDKNTSLVLLRPFKILSYYDTAIREWQSKLLREHETPNPKVEAQPIMTGALQEPESDADLIDKRDPLNPPTNEEDKGTVEDPNGYSMSKTALEHLPRLLEFMDTYLSSKKTHLNSPGCDKISFSDIWYLFKPGETVISNDGKQAYRIANISTPSHKGTDRWSVFSASAKDNNSSSADADMNVSCIYIHFDGKRLGPVLKEFKIRRFDGQKSVTTLEILPLRLYVSRILGSPTQKAKFEGSAVDDAHVETDAARLKQTLIERGRKFVEVAGVKHMYYAGLTIDTRDEVESQVVIDFEEAFASENRREKWCPKVTSLVSLASELEDAQFSNRCEAMCCWGENVHSDSYVERSRCEKFIGDLMEEVEGNKLPSVIIYPRTLEDTKSAENELKDEELLIMSYGVFGFVLRDRTWGEYTDCPFTYLSIHELTLFIAQLDLSYLISVNNSTVEDNINENDESDDDEDDKTAFGRLVLPRGHKKMVLSLIAQHFRNKESQQDKDEQVDIVRGKGMSLVLFNIACCLKQNVH